MKILLCILLIVNYHPANSQRTVNFEMDIAGDRVTASHYNHLELLDARKDSSSLGIVQVGVGNKRVKVYPKRSLQRQFAGMIDSLIDNTANDGHLLLMLRDFKFAEVTGRTSERGYIYLKAIMFANENERFRQLGSIDTVILVKAGDVTKPMFRRASKTIMEFMRRNLKDSTTTDITYTKNDLLALDSIEKGRLPVYTNEKFRDGIYEDYRSFSQQIPQSDVIASMEDGSLSEVKVVDSNGKASKVKTKDQYAVVYQGQPFVATDFGYYRLQRINNELLFTGKAAVALTTGEMIAAQAFFGILGSLTASSDEATFDMQIDHTNGGFVRLRQVANISQ